MTQICHQVCHQLRRHRILAMGQQWEEAPVADPELRSGGVHQVYWGELGTQPRGWVWENVPPLVVGGGFGGPPPRKFFKSNLKMVTSEAFVEWNFRRLYLRNYWADFDKLDLVGKLLKSSTIWFRSRPGGAHVRPMRPPLNPPLGPRDRRGLMSWSDVWY